MQIRSERPGDAAAIRTLTEAAFKGVAFSDETEGRIVDALREAGALTLSVIAINEDAVVGHAAFSPVRIGGVAGGWYGLGPVSVWPALQRRGIGQAVIRDGLQRLRAMGGDGCVVFGAPDYYGRFGFTCDPRLTYAGAPLDYFLRLVFRGPDPQGDVTYHAGFEVT